METYLDRIEKNPDVMLGKPVIKGTRIPVELIIRKLGEGASIEDLLDAYPNLGQNDIHAALLQGWVVAAPGLADLLQVEVEDRQVRAIH